MPFHASCRALTPLYPTQPVSTPPRPTSRRDRHRAAPQPTHRPTASAGPSTGVSGPVTGVPSHVPCPHAQPDTCSCAAAAAERGLEAAYTLIQYPTPTAVLQMVELVSLPSSSVKAWFAQRRSRDGSLAAGVSWGGGGADSDGGGYDAAGASGGGSHDRAGEGGGVGNAGAVGGPKPRPNARPKSRPTARPKARRLALTRARWVARSVPTPVGSPTAAADSGSLAVAASSSGGGGGGGGSGGGGSDTDSGSGGASSGVGGTAGEAGVNGTGGPRKRHMRMRTRRGGLRQHPCTVAGCGKTFTRAHDLMAHTKQVRRVLGG